MDELFQVLELLGTAAFAVSGAMVAIDRRADLFGVIFLGMTTAIGGGILRDCLLGRFPAAIFYHWETLAMAFICSLTVFLCAWAAGERYWRRAGLVDQINNLIDALGLGAFSVTGVRIGLEAGCGGRWFFLIFLGMTTAVGGGLLRDVMTISMPFVLTKRIYALASIAGAALYLLLESLGVSRGAGGFGAVAAVFVLRLLATHFHWNLPRIPENSSATDSRV